MNFKIVSLLLIKTLVKFKHTTTATTTTLTHLFDKMIDYLSKYINEIYA